MSAIAFLDESGDESGKLDRGASPLFVVGLVVFLDSSEAERCDGRIAQLRRELHKHPRFEFRFRDNGHADRLAFLAAVAPFRFTYYSVTLEKPNSPQARQPAYLVACARVCGLAGEALKDARLIVDAGQVGRFARRRQTTVIRQWVNGESGSIVLADVRAQDSVRHNLIQLADYVAGVRHWLEQGRQGAPAYAELLRAREGPSVRERL